MSVELRHVRYLLAVAEHGGFTRAAEVLHVSQPTLSQQIRKLEATLGAALLDRSGRQVRLTDTGVAFLERAKVGLREVLASERAVSDVRDLSRGELRLGVTPTFNGGALVSPISDFANLAPGVRVSVSTAAQVNLEEKLLNDELDLALGFAGRHAPGVVADTIYEEHLRVAIRMDRDAPAGPADPEWLSQQRLALLPPSFATRVHIDRYLNRLGVQAQVTFEADSVAMLIQTVKRTELTTILPAHVIASEPDIRSAGTIGGRTVVLLHRDGAYVSAAASAFRRVLAAWRPDTDVP